MIRNIISGVLLLLLSSNYALAQGLTLANPILFVAQVPLPLDSSSVTTVFSNHLAGPVNAARGSDLYIYYPDHTLKNLTKLAGFGSEGIQGAQAIGVRQPTIHWSGKKALVSMVVGAPTSQGQQGQYFWQIYEVKNLGETETPVITKIANQPTNYNNLSPIYGTDDRILFSSDRPRIGQDYLYPIRDERFSFPATTGLWSLDPASGDVFQLNIAPSGAFSPFIDSYGRVVFTRWDHLQRDENADKDALSGKAMFGTFNYSDETRNANMTASRTEVFPEPSPNRTDLLNGTNLKGLTFDQFTPWQINEDGTSEETLNHIGRHEILSNFQGSITDDPNVTDFSAANSGRLNSGTALQDFLQISEDPTKAGLYYGVNVLQSGFDQHSSGQIISLNADPKLDPSTMALTYVTDAATSISTLEGHQPDPNNSGHYRNPLPLASGQLLCVHTSETRADKNGGSRSQPKTRYDFRITSMKKVGAVWVADSLVTPGITKSVSYWDPDTLVTYSGPLWELDPVEVRPKTIPTRRTSTLATPEAAVFLEEGVDEVSFRGYMRQHDLALFVSRNITHRDKSDHQQPYYLKVHGASTQSANASGKIYDIAHIEFYQADYLRGLTYHGPSPVPGRRVLAEFMHDSAATANPHPGSEELSSVKIADDGSFAAFVPPHRAMAWALTDSAFNDVVRERYWVTAQPGEIRVCASCHGTNDDALVHADPPPQNKPEALRDLLKYWKSSHAPLSTELISPPNESGNIPLSPTLSWNRAPNATAYKLTLATTQDFSHTIFNSPILSDTSYSFSSNLNAGAFYWRVQTFDGTADSAYSGIWMFTTAGNTRVESPGSILADQLSNYPNPFSGATVIAFTLPRTEIISIGVFDILGRKVEDFGSGIYTQGKHEVTWDASKLPIGTYLFRITSSEGVLSRILRVVR